MAVSLPNTLYIGGAVALDSTPYVNVYLQHKAEQKARADSFIKSVLIIIMQK